MTVVLDYMSGRVRYAGERRGPPQGNAGRVFFRRDDGCAEGRGSKRWRWTCGSRYINRVKAHCPQAKIVFDLFHLVKAFGEVIDEVRRSEYTAATKAEKEVFKDSRYLLLKNDENLSDKQRDHLEELLNLNATLSAVYILKDQLKMIYMKTTRLAVKRALNQWCRMAETINHPMMKKYIGRLKFFEYGILNHADHLIGTSKLEGVNNKIKVIKRKAYGFHDERYFALKIIQAFSGN